MVKHCISIVVGSFLLIVGIMPIQQLGLRLIDDETITDIFVGSGGGGNEKCKVPEPDCESTECYASGGGCSSKDDYPFAENNSCVTNAGTVCDLSDYANCFTRYTCDKNPLYECSDGDEECSVPGQNCTSEDVKAYDDCETK